MVKKDSKSRTLNFLRMGRRLARPGVRLFGRASAPSPCERRGIPWRATEAAELVEFALLLPMLLVMIIGLLDFATAYNLKQKLANAAREGARMGSSQTLSDVSSSSPASVKAIKDDVVTYLQQAGVSTSFISNSMSYTATTPFTATYYSSGTYGLKIERAVNIANGSGPVIFATRVTLIYPYDWTYGFNRIIKLLVPSATGASRIGIETDATMADLQ